MAIDHENRVFDSSTKPGTGALLEGPKLKRPRNGHFEIPKRYRELSLVIQFNSNIYKTLGSPE